MKRLSKNWIKKAVFGCLFAILGLFGVMGLAPVERVYADPPANSATTTDTSDATNTANTTNTTDAANAQAQGTGTQEVMSCKDSLESLGWWICPTTGKIAEATDWLYNKIEDVLVIDPVEMKDGSPIYEIWKYAKGVTNIVFIILFLVVIYSQVTGVGITNYGVKKILPKLIVVAILMNLSFIVCSLAVDVSNIVGGGLRGLFASVEESVLATMDWSGAADISMAGIYDALAVGTGAAILGGGIAIETGAIWMLIPVVLGAIVAVASGLITIALRQAVVALLIMISPLAIVAYMLPNTEGMFKKWKDLFTRMLVFYPMFSLLFGASQLAGFAIMASAKDVFGLLLGVAVQIFPLFFSWKMMAMSGTFLSTIHGKIQGLAAKPLAVNRAWAESRRINAKANTLANGVTPSARLSQYLDKRRALREEDTKNALSIAAGKSSLYVQRKIADSEIGETTSRSRRTSRYTRNAKTAKNYSMMAQNAVAHTEHVMGNYSSYFKNDIRDNVLAQQSERAWLDYGRAAYQKEMDDENDINFLVDKYLEANKRDANNKPIDEVAFNRYVSSVAGPNGEQRLMAKIIAQAAKVESKQRSEFAIMYAKWGHNGYNKKNFRDFIVGYRVNDDGWAVDENGKRLQVEVKDEHGRVVMDRNGKPIMKNLELVQGDAITKAPERLVLYNKRDSQGLYYDFKDQNGNIVARIHRGTGDDGVNHDDAAFVKESLAAWDVPISDPINNVYGILSGIKVGDIETPQGKNEIGLARYSTTIGRAMSNYKGDASWAGAMFNTGIGNRQIKNASQYAIWVLDSIKKTLKPGAFNTQNPASVEYLRTIFDPNNWDKIFTEEAIRDAVNINNELFGGEDWELDADGNIVGYTPVKNPSYEQRMNTIKRKLIFPALSKVLPAFDRLRTSNTADNQKPGTADEQYEFLKMVEEKYENNPAMPFDPTLVNQDLQTAARDFRRRKHDKDGNLIYFADNSGERLENLLNQLDEVYSRSLIVEDLIRDIFGILNSRPEYSRALERFNELCGENPNATMSDIYSWFQDLDCLVKYD